MALLEKEYHFATTTEGWTSYTDGSAEMAHYIQHKARNSRKAISRPRPDAPLGVMGGCLRTTARRNSAASANYWSLVASWETIGIPAGATVTAVQADYIWRVDLKHKHPQDHSLAQWGVDEVRSGPFSLYDSLGDVLEQFSEADFAPERDERGDMYNAYPLGGAEDAVSFKPAAWRDIVGANVPVTGDQQISEAIVEFRLANGLPATVDDVRQWIRLKQDYVKLSITFTPPPPDVNPRQFFFGVG